MKYTNLEAQRELEKIGKSWKMLDEIEMTAYFGLLYLNGAFKYNAHPVRFL